MRPLARHNINKVLLVAPYKGSGGICDMFIAPNMGLYRIKFYIEERLPGVRVDVVDPNIEKADFGGGGYDAIGFSLTHTTLEHDMGLIYRAKKESQGSLIMAGGIEATFSHAWLLEVAPLDCVVLGEGEEPLEAIIRSYDGTSGLESIAGLPGVAIRGARKVAFGRALNREKFSRLSSLIDFSRVPYDVFWRANAVQYAEPDPQVINTVRVFTSNYCPHNCTFCSSTNFLDYACSGVFGKRKQTKVVALDPAEIIAMITRVTDARCDVKTIIFDDDNFVISSERLNSFSRMVIDAKSSGRIPADLTFICQARIDNFRSAAARGTMRLMKEAGFRMIMFGVESFSQGVLAEFGKKTDMALIDEVLKAARAAGVKALIYLILFSPRSTMGDVRHTITRSLEYLSMGMEASLNFYIMDIPGCHYTLESGLARDCREVPVNVDANEVARFKKSEFLYPLDASVRDFAREVETAYPRYEDFFKREFGIRHIPGRVYAFIVFYAILDMLKSGDEKNRLLDMFGKLDN